MASDNVARSYSKDATPHRDLWTVDPPMQGDDVKALQRGIRDRLRARGVSKDDVPVALHGKFTYLTGLAAIEAAYRLGAASSTYLEHDAEWHRCCSIGMQRLVITGRRNPVQMARSIQRKGMTRKDNRYYEGFLKSHVGPDAAVRPLFRALDYAQSHIGTTEHPSGSNRGPYITDWQHAAGYRDAVPWCGCFVNACLMAAGLPSGTPWGIGYVPYIASHAKAGIDGWKWIPADQGQPGDLACFLSGGEWVHVEIVTDHTQSAYQTIGGNTSSSAEGSQSNGGGVFRKTRSTTGSFRIGGFARPPYTN